MSSPSNTFEVTGPPTRGVLTLLALAVSDLLLLPVRLLLAAVLARRRRDRMARAILGPSAGSTPPPVPSGPGGSDADATHDPARG